MASSKPTDEILAALPEIGLRLWILADNGSAGWYAVVCDANHPNQQWCGDGPGPAPALIAALKDAGVDVGNEPNPDAAYLRDLASRLFMFGTPNTGTDQGDSSRLEEIADKL